MDTLNNPWVIGIGGGIVSGLLVTWISRAFLSRRDQREYAQKVLGANREVIYAVRPGISEGLVPAVQVIDSIVEATARRNGVDRKDLYRPFEIAQELMKEVMDSSFISAKTKEEYCNRLCELAQPKAAIKATVPADLEILSQSIRSSAVADYRSRMVTTMSMMMGVLTMTMTIVLAFSKDNALQLFSNETKGRFSTMLLPALLALLATTFSAFLMSTVKDLRNKVESRRREAEMKEGDSGRKPTNEP